jgi:predicted GIY-YIG superfamily endonuclease
MRTSRMPYCYLLRCADDSYYCGSTRNELNVRIEQHRSGLGSDYTAKRLPGLSKKQLFARQRPRA